MLLSVARFNASALFILRGGILLKTLNSILERHFEIGSSKSRLGCGGGVRFESWRCGTDTRLSRKRSLRRNTQLELKRWNFNENDLARDAELTHPRLTLLELLLRFEHFQSLEEWQASANYLRLGLFLNRCLW